MKKLVMMLALVVALGGCAMMTEGLGGSNRVHFDGTADETVKEFGIDENGEPILVKETHTVTGGVVTGDTLAGLGRSIEGASTGKVSYNPATGQLNIDFSENAFIEGGVAQDLGAAFKAGVEAFRDASIAESENQSGNAALAEFQKEFNARIDAIQAQIDTLLEATNADDIVDEARVRTENEAERERIRQIVDTANDARLELISLGAE